MPREYRHVQEYEKEIIELREQGLSIWKLRWKLFRIRCMEVYMKYVKIIIWAIIEIIAELYNKKTGKG